MGGNNGVFSGGVLSSRSRDENILILEKNKRIKALNFPTANFDWMSVFFNMVDIRHAENAHYSSKEFLAAATRCDKRWKEGFKANTNREWNFISGSG